MGNNELIYRCVIDPYASRKILIDTMLTSGLLIDNNLGSGYTDFHDNNNNCCVQFNYKDGNSTVVRMSS